MAKKIKYSKSYFSWFARFPEKAILFGSALLFFAFYPGQNYYQTLKIFWKDPEINVLRKGLSLSPAPYPSVKGISSPPVISARAVVVMDVPSAVVLYEKDSYATLSPASTTKIMTALVALDHYRMDDILTVNKLENEGAKMGLTVGDHVTVESLLYGLLINSGNDAAFVLAENFPGGNLAFVEAMNKKAYELSLIRTHFANVNGFTQKDHFTTAIDLARLTTVALQNPNFSHIVGIKSIVVTDAFHKKYYHLENVNKLLGVLPGITGVKTGWTNEAGECLVASAIRNGRQLVSVVLGSNDRFSDTARLLDWGFSSFTWEESQATGRQ